MKEAEVMTTQVMTQPKGRPTSLTLIAMFSLLGGLAWLGVAIAGFAGILPPWPEQGLGTVSFLNVTSPIGIVFGPLAIAGSIGLFQQQGWGRTLFMIAGYFALIVSACRTFSFLNPQSTALIPAKLIITALAAILLWSVVWVQDHSEYFHHH